jgi:integrase
MRGSLRRHRRAKGWVYEAVFDAGPDPATGKRRQRSRCFGTRKEADAYLRQRIGEVERGEYAEAGGMTVGVLLDRWLESEARLRVGASTFSDYERAVRVYLAPLAARPLARLTPAYLQEFFTDMVARGVGVTSVKYACSRLAQALRMAFRLGLVASVATDRVQLGVRGKSGVREIWTRQQLDRFMDGARDSRFRLVYLLCLCSTLRIGEVLALRWSDLDLESGMLAVRGTYSRVGTAMSLRAPKSRSSRRSVRLPATVLRLVRARREVWEAERQRAANMWGEDDLVICSEFGKAVHPDTVRKEFGRVLRSAGLPHARLHDLRHICISVMLASGVPLPDVARLAGHARASVTAGVYAHALGVADVSGVMEEALFGGL